MTKQGVAAIFGTTGNSDCHVILRGGQSGPNYSRDCILPILETLQANNLPPYLMVDCSHGNSEKNHQRQSIVLNSIIEQRREIDHGVFGVMIESHLVEGNQPIKAEISSMKFGQSVTDKCIGWDETCRLLKLLSDS